MDMSDMSSPGMLISFQLQVWRSAQERVSGTKEGSFQLEESRGIKGWFVG